MSLKDVRDKFVEITGRADFVGEGSIVGADFYINEGQKMLDRLLDGGKSGARYFVDLETTQILVLLPTCRVIKKVFIADSESRIELTKVDRHELMNYFNEPKENLDSGKPAYYAPVWARPFPGTVITSDYSQEWLLDSIIDSGHENYNAILVYPPSDTDTYTLEVWGLFYSDELVNDEDRTWWTEVHPLLLIKAAAYQIELTYRNTEGAKDWMGIPDMPGTILGDIKSLNMDIVEEEIEEIRGMEG